MRWPKVWWRHVYGFITGIYFTKSGKRARRRGRINALGESVTLVQPVNSDGTVDYTSDELAAMTIRCAWCGRPIVVGEPVTLYMSKQGFRIPVHIDVVGYRDGDDPEESLRLVGCMRTDCAYTGEDRSGFWVPGVHGKGCVYRVLSPLEHTLLGSSGDSDDLGSLEEARRADEKTLKRIAEQGEEED